MKIFYVFVGWAGFFAHAFKSKPFMRGQKSLPTLLMSRLFLLS